MLLEIDGARKNLKKSLRRSRKKSLECKTRRSKSKRSRKSRRTKSKRSRKNKRTKSKRSRRTKSKRSRKNKRTKSKRSRRTKSKRSRKSRRTKSKRSRRTKSKRSRKSRRTKSKRSRKSRRSKKARSLRNKKALDTCIEFGSRSKRCKNSLKRVTKRAKKSIRKILRSFQIPTAKSSLKAAQEKLRQQMFARQQSIAQKLRQTSVLGSIIVSSKEEPMPVTSAILNIANIIIENPEVKASVIDALNVKSSELPLLNKIDTAIAIAQNLPRDVLLLIKDSPLDATKIIEDALKDIEKEMPKPEVSVPNVSAEVISEVFGPKVSFTDISTVAGLIQNSSVVQDAIGSSLELSSKELPMLEDANSARTIVETLPPSVVIAVLNASSEPEKAAIIENALEGSKGKETAEVVTIANVIDSVPKIDEKIADILDLPRGSHDTVNKTDTIEIIASKLSDRDLAIIEAASTPAEKANALINAVERVSSEVKIEIEDYNSSSKIILEIVSDILDIPVNILIKSEELFEKLFTEEEGEILGNLILENNISELKRRIEQRLLFQRDAIREKIQNLFPDEIKSSEEEIVNKINEQFTNLELLAIANKILYRVRVRNFDYYIANLKRLLVIQNTKYAKAVKYLMGIKNEKPISVIYLAKAMSNDLLDKINSSKDDTETRTLINDYLEKGDKAVDVIIQKVNATENIAFNIPVQQAIIDVAKLSKPEETEAEVIIGDLNTIEKIIDSLPPKVVEDLSNASSVAEQIEVINKAVDATPSISDNIKKALKECKCDDLLFDLLKAYPNNVLREISESQFMYYSRLAADRNINLCSGGKTYRECFEEYGFKITTEPTKVTVTLSDDFKNKLTQALKQSKNDLVSIADEDDKKIVNTVIDSAKSEDLSKVAVQLLLLDDIKPSSSVTDIANAIENNASAISDSLLVPADIFMADEPAVVKDVAANIINDNDWQKIILDNLPFSTEDEKKASNTLKDSESVLALVSSLPESTVSAIANASSVEEQKDLLANAIIENRTLALSVLEECLCDDVVVDILAAFPEKIINEKFVGDYYQQANKKFTNCIIKSYDSYVDCLRSKGVTILLDGDEVAKIKPNEPLFYPVGEFKEAFDYFISHPEINTENLLKTVKFPSQIKTEADKLTYLMREQNAVANYTKGENVLEYITNYMINIDEYTKYLKQNDPEFKYVLGKFEVPYYIMNHDYNKFFELLPKAEKFFQDKNIYNRYLEKYKYTPEFRWIIDNPNIKDKDDLILVLLYKKHLKNIRENFKPIYKKGLELIKAQKTREYNEQLKVKIEAVKRGLKARPGDVNLGEMKKELEKLQEKINIKKETKEEEEKEQKFQDAYKYFKTIAYSMVRPPLENYDIFGTTQYAILDTPSDDLVDEQIQNIVKYLQDYYKNTNFLTEKDVIDRAISAYGKFKDLIPPKSAVTDTDLARAEKYFEDQGAGYLWNTSGDVIFKQLLNGYQYNPFIIAINTGIKDPETRLRHLKYAVFKLANNELF